MVSDNPIHIVGAGLAGSEAAFQLAEMGHSVVLWEMRSKKMTPAHKTNLFAELVCSNSLGSQTDYSAPGQLKWEARKLGSLILKAAEEAHIPAGMALGVDRTVFANAITTTLENHPNIEIKRELVKSLSDIPRPCILATGPLTDESLALDVQKHLKSDDDEKEFLYFFDAIAPIIDTDSINMGICFKQNRWDFENPGQGDYINCPMDKETYYKFIQAIKDARKIEPKEFEKTPYFDACMPVEAIIEKGDETIRFGPMSPKGLRNPHNDERPYAVVQLRQENKDATAWNMVGFQTKMAYGDQKEVFRMIPGLEEAEFLKLGSIHRNMYIHTPRKLTQQLQSQNDPGLFFAGQITGVEGYFDSTCIGLLVSRFVDNYVKGVDFNLPPRASAFGSLLNAITEEKERFQPTNISFGLFPPLVGKGREYRGSKGKRAKRDQQLVNAKEAFEAWLTQQSQT